MKAVGPKKTPVIVRRLRRTYWAVSDFVREPRTTVPIVASAIIAILAVSWANYQVERAFSEFDLLGKMPGWMQTQSVPPDAELDGVQGMIVSALFREQEPVLKMISASTAYACAWRTETLATDAMVVFLQNFPVLSPQTKSVCADSYLAEIALAATTIADFREARRADDAVFWTRALSISSLLLSFAAFVVGPLRTLYTAPKKKGRDTDVELSQSAPETEGPLNGF